MAFEHYIYSGQKKLRCGYTTGTSAALAAGGAVQLLLTGSCPPVLSLVSPAGITVSVPPAHCACTEHAALCAVQKDGGDDADATDGLEIVAEVTRAEAPGIELLGGAGVGRVTKPGLDQPVGAAAINRVPRAMIAQQVQAVCARCGYTGGLRVTLSIPGGEAVAQRTFNPQLGVVGGLSILGTSGIVEPMSEQALVDTIAVELGQAAAEGARRIILTPGNYGVDFLRQNGFLAGGVPMVKCSNFVGDALDLAAVHGFGEVLLVGHIGKLVKLAGGIMNTHSRAADCRTELFCAHAACVGAGAEVCRALYDAPTTDACLAVLDGAQLRAPVLQSLLAAIERHLMRRAAGAYRVGAVLFSNEYGLLGQTETAKEILREWNSKKEPSTR